MSTHADTKEFFSTEFKKKHGAVHDDTMQFITSLDDDKQRVLLDFLDSVVLENIDCLSTEWDVSRVPYGVATHKHIKLVSFIFLPTTFYTISTKMMFEFTFAYVTVRQLGLYNEITNASSMTYEDFEDLLESGFFKSFFSTNNIFK